MVLSVLAMMTACAHTGDVATDLAVKLRLDHTTVGINDTLSGTITLRNKTLYSVTIKFPNQQQSELLLFDAQGILSVNWPAVRSPATSKLVLGPLCRADYEFSFCPDDFRTVTELEPGTYRVRARPADHDQPYTETTVILTD